MKGSHGGGVRPALVIRERLDHGRGGFRQFRVARHHARNRGTRTAVVAMSSSPCHFGSPATVLSASEAGRQGAAGIAASRAGLQPSAAGPNLPLTACTIRSSVGPDPMQPADQLDAQGSPHDGLQRSLSWSARQPLMTNAGLTPITPSVTYEHIVLHWTIVPHDV